MLKKNILAYKDSDNTEHYSSHQFRHYTCRLYHLPNICAIFHIYIYGNKISLNSLHGLTALSTLQFKPQ